MIDKIKSEETTTSVVDTARSFDVALNTSKKRIVKAAINYIGLVIALLIFCLVIFVLTQRIKTTEVDVTDIGDYAMEFLVVLLGNIGIYICVSDSGSRAGTQTQSYIDAFKKRIELRSQIEQRTLLDEFSEYVKEYVASELKNAKKKIINGLKITEEDYYGKYILLTNSEIKKLTEITKVQKKAIIRANRMKEIRLTPNMIYSTTDNKGRRSPLAVNPMTTRNIHYASKIILTLIISVILTFLACDIATEPTLAKAGEVIVKAVFLLISLFMGYRMGFDNKAIDAVDFMESQNNFMSEFLSLYQGQPSGQESGQESGQNQMV